MNLGLAERGLRPAAELAQARPHGERLRYVGGCRCEECRAANSRYECERASARKAGDWNGIVPAAKALEHILALRKQGVGRRAIGAAADVGDTCLTDIIAGRKLSIRARTERAILAVTREMASDHALIPAGPTWKLIEQLKEEGYTVADLAKRLGYVNPSLQFGKKQLTVRTAYEVQQLHRRLMS